MWGETTCLAMFTSLMPRMCDSLIFFTFRHVFLWQVPEALNGRARQGTYWRNVFCTWTIAVARTSLYGCVFKNKALVSISSCTTNWRWCSRTRSSLLVSLALWEIISVQQSMTTFVTLGTNKYGTIMWWHVSVETTEPQFVLFCNSIALLRLHAFKFITLVQHKHLICGAVFQLDLY